jgi:Tfp pilus assembly protein PilF
MTFAKWIAAAFLATSTAAAMARAEPFVPKSDSEVLERLPVKPNDPAARKLRELRIALARFPQDLALAVDAARAYIDQGRADSDPRFFGYAQAALAPWWNDANAPNAVRVLRATLNQNQHRFAQALVDLDAVLAANPRTAQALITRATIHQVRGDYALARRDCARLTRLADALVAAACVANVDANNGKLRASYARLAASAQDLGNVDASVRGWVLSTLAELAARAGEAAAARGYFERALTDERADAYLRAAYADFLLDAREFEKVVELTREHTRNDGLLLRLALAEKQLGLASAKRHIAELQARFEAAALRGERVHLREEARFTLHLKGEAARALELALENWAIQKEPADARIALEAAKAAGQAQRAGAIERWKAEHFA